MENNLNFIIEGSSNKESIIFLHGIGGDSNSWEFQLKYFSKEFKTVAWDMPGYGSSKLEKEMTFKYLSDSLVILMDQLEIEKCHLVGHSMGGMVAQQAIAASSDRFKSLILSATSPAFGKPDGDFQKEFISARLKPLDDGLSMAHLAEKQVPTMIGDEPNSKGVEIALKSMSKLSKETYVASMHCLVTFDRRDNLGLINLPTLLIAGEKDKNAPAPMMEKMGTKISNSEYVCIPGAGHLANMERPEQFNNIIYNFIANIS